MCGPLGWTLGLGLACTESPPPPKLPSDPAAILAMPDPVAQIAALDRLGAKGAILDRGFCGQLGAGPAGEHCLRLVQRPHLSEGLRLPRDSDEGIVGPKDSEILPTLQVPEPPFSGPIPTLVCGDGDLVRCRSEAARGAHIAGAVDAASGHCRALPEDSVRDECHFSAADALRLPIGADQHAGYARLCLAAGDFQARCFQHLSARMARGGPRQTPVAVWTQMTETADAIERFWAPRDARFGALQVDRLWSFALVYTYGTAPQVTGAAMDHVPGVAHPHVRAAAAWRLAQGGSTGSLAGDVARLSGALEARDALQSAAKPVPHPLVLWDSALQGVLPDPPSGAQVVFCLGPGRRLLGSQPAQELAIVVLEAAARQDPTQQTLLDEGVNHPDPSVAWTAQRLLAELAQRGAQKVPPQ